jgi:hypothetical protein
MSGYEFMVANDVFRGRFRNSLRSRNPLRLIKRKNIQSTCTA